MTETLLFTAVGLMTAGLIATRRWGRSPWRWLIWPQAGLVVLATGLGYAGQVPPALVSFPFADKILHCLLIGAAGFWLNLWFGGRRWRFGVPAAIALMAALVTAEELLQGLSPARALDALDWLANLTGLALAWWASERLNQSLS